MRVLLSTLVAVALGLMALSQSVHAQTPEIRSGITTAQEKANQDTTNKAAPKAPMSAAAAAAAAGQLQAPTARPVVGADKSPEDRVKYLQTLVTRAHSDCTVSQVKIIGPGSDSDLYEVACTNGTGQIVVATVPQTDTSAVTAASCLTVENSSAKSKCTLTTAAANLAPFKDLASKAPTTPCDSTGQRFVGATADGTYYFEYACPDKTGFLLKADGAGTIKSEIPCLNAASVGATCTLTDTAAASAALRATLTTTAKAAGSDCSVSKFADYAKKPDSPYTATEITCDNHPEGGVIMRNGDKTVVMNCVRARVEGYRCGLSPEAAVYPLLTTELKTAKVTKNYTSCDVNGAQSLGASATAAYVEVTCADGNPGFVISYPLGSKTPTEITTCSEAGGLGGCRMAQNVPK